MILPSRSPFSIEYSLQSRRIYYTLIKFVSQLAGRYLGRQRRLIFYDFIPPARTSTSFGHSLGRKCKRVQRIRLWDLLAVYNLPLVFGG